MTALVREAVPAEYDTIGELTVAAYSVFAETGADSVYVDELRDVAGRARCCPIYVALDPATGRIIGGATYVPGPGTPLSELERDGEAGIRMLAVAPEAQGHGAGRALVEALLGRARAEGRRGMALYTFAEMTAAHRIYERYGFRREPARDWQFDPSLLLLAYSLDFAEAARGDGTTTAGPA
jgi:ribosomal protein S18 acetylase RimI-like enzyme